MKIRICIKVAPLVGAWIEIHNLHDKSLCIPVAPLVGAWIEIKHAKSGYKNLLVAPLVGAWIEIENPMSIIEPVKCRSSCRSVD